MNTFLVFKVMAECAPFIIGGKDNTVLEQKSILSQYTNKPSAAYSFRGINGIFITYTNKFNKSELKLSDPVQAV